MADDTQEKKSRLEKRFAAAGRSPDDVVRVRDLIEYDREHHEHQPTPAASDSTAKKSRKR